ncbi:MAG: hypothetical protein RL701_2987 [Pseudomonadota bacterium]|jgi:D-glycero-D-manno-heptose 1,7-bisphosphate phosphatase
MQLKRAVFLDRDGVINQTVHRRGKARAPQDFSEFAWVEGLQSALAALHARGFLLLVCTNQPDVARGWQTREQVEAFHRHITSELPIARVYACFHDDADGCECRKPRPGMLLAGARDFAVDLASSYMVGDRASDVAAGRAAGCQTIYLRHAAAGAIAPAADLELTHLQQLAASVR